MKTQCVVIDAGGAGLAAEIAAAESGISVEVLNKKEASIPGLYAAGVDTGGWTSDTYCGKIPGTTFGFALNSGRIAGENAAQFVKVNRML